MLSIRESAGLRISLSVQYEPNTRLKPILQAQVRPLYMNGDTFCWSRNLLAEQVPTANLFGIAECLPVLTREEQDDLHLLLEKIAERLMTHIERR